MREKAGIYINGWFILLLHLVVGIALVSILLMNNTLPEDVLLIFGFYGTYFVLLILTGFFMLNPNETRVLQFAGNYIGTVKGQGLKWTFPFISKAKLSVRVNNFETQKIKVNDLLGNPIEVATIIVWKITDTAKASFEVEDYQSFVQTQSEAALRSLVTRYPYESFEEGKKSLITNTHEVAEALKVEAQAKLEMAGVEVVEARMSHLAYSSEIAASMLQRQQASAVLAAKKIVVDGAVGMVEDAMNLLEQKGIVAFENEHKAKLVSNLLVVLCSDQGVKPMLDMQN